jgi:hypothetical protein
MRSVEIAYRDNALVLTACPWGSCVSDASICGNYEGMDSSQKAVQCSLDDREAA